MPQWAEPLIEAYDNRSVCLCTVFVCVFMSIVCQFVCVCVCVCVCMSEVVQDGRELALVHIHRIRHIQ